jgi:hypothetical protein
MYVPLWSDYRLLRFGWVGGGYVLRSPMVKPCNGAVHPGQPALKILYRWADGLTPGPLAIVTV